MVVSSVTPLTDSATVVHFFESAASELKTALEPLGLVPELEARNISESAFKNDPSASNRIWIADRPLEDWLGDMKAFLDVSIDQGPEGLEFIPGRTTYTFRANWKLQIENCVDGYHLTSTHPSFMKIVERRKQGQSSTPLRNIDFNLYGSLSVVSGGFTFPYGHAVLWSGNPAPETRPIFPGIEEVRSRVGDVRARWMLKARNLTLFPNVQFAESASLQMRVIRPIAPDLTEMTIHCIAPVGEAPAVRANRIRLYEGKEPLFHHYKIEDEIARIQQRRVPLEGGGSLVIDQTEALVAIDVNSGSSRADDDALRIGLGLRPPNPRPIRHRPSEP